MMDRRLRRPASRRVPRALRLAIAASWAAVVSLGGGGRATGDGSSSNALFAFVSFPMGLLPTASAYLPPSPCFQALDDLGEQMRALEASRAAQEEAVSAMGARLDRGVIGVNGGGVEGGFFGGAFQGWGRRTDAADGSSPGVSATGERAAALGDATAATGDFSVAAGSASRADGAASLAIGDQSRARGKASVALGVQSAAGGDGAAALGMFTRADGLGSTAGGVNARADGEAAVALGTSATARGDGSVSAGVFTRSTGAAAFSAGGGGEALGDLSTALGTYTMAQGLSSTAMVGRERNPRADRAWASRSAIGLRRARL